MVEHVALEPDGAALLVSANTGPDAVTSIAGTSARAGRRRAPPAAVTPGTGLEWTPVLTGDGRHVAYVGATAQRPPLPAVMPSRKARAPRACSATTACPPTSRPRGS